VPNGKRKEFSAKTREQALERCKDAAGVPRCEGCGADLRNKRKRFDHIKRDVDGGDNSLANCQVLCEELCDKQKTGREHREHLKAVRARRAHDGTKKPPKKPLRSRNYFLVVVHKPHATATPEKLAHLPRRRLFR
jgi:hypothetical protein